MLVLAEVGGMHDALQRLLESHLCEAKRSRGETRKGISPGHALQLRFKRCLKPRHYCERRTADDAHHDTGQGLSLVMHFEAEQGSAGCLGNPETYPRTGCDCAALVGNAGLLGHLADSFVLYRLISNETHMSTCLLLTPPWANVLLKCNDSCRACNFG